MIVLITEQVLKYVERKDCISLNQNNNHRNYHNNETRF